MEILKKEFLYSEDKDYNIILLFKNNYKEIGLYNSLEDEKVILNNNGGSNIITSTNVDTTTNIIELTTVNNAKLSTETVLIKLNAINLDCVNKLHILSGNVRIAIGANQSRYDIKGQLLSVDNICEELIVMENRLSTNILNFSSKYDSVKQNIKSIDVSELKFLIDSIGLLCVDIDNKIKYVDDIINSILNNNPPPNVIILKQNCVEYSFKSQERIVIVKEVSDSLIYLQTTTTSYETKLIELKNVVINTEISNTSTESSSSEIIIDSQDLTSTKTFTITGTAESRLNDVRGYDNETPYKVDVNGVVIITNEYIGYKIDNIEYTTYYTGDLINLVPTKTIYKTQGSRTYTNGVDDKSVNHFIYKDEKNSFIERGKISNDIFLERNPIAVNDYYFRLNHINSADDFINYF